MLLFQKYNYWWLLNAKKVKRTQRSKLRLHEEQWGKAVDHACLAYWVLSETKKDPQAAHLNDLWSSGI